jgi:hypothetical protein
MEPEQQRKQGIQSLAQENGNSAEVAQTWEEWGKIGKGIKAESMEKVWGRSTDDEERQTRMDITEGV